MSNLNYTFNENYLITRFSNGCIPTQDDFKHLIKQHHQHVGEISFFHNSFTPLPGWIPLQSSKTLNLLGTSLYLSEMFKNVPSLTNDNLTNFYIPSCQTFDSSFTPYIFGGQSAKIFRSTYYPFKTYYVYGLVESNGGYTWMQELSTTVTVLPEQTHNTYMYVSAFKVSNLPFLSGAQGIVTNDSLSANLYTINFNSSEPSELKTPGFTFRTKLPFSSPELVPHLLITSVTGRGNASFIEGLYPINSTYYPYDSLISVKFNTFFYDLSSVDFFNNIQTVNPGVDYNLSVVSVVTSWMPIPYVKYDNDVIEFSLDQVECLRTNMTFKIALLSCINNYTTVTTTTTSHDVYGTLGGGFLNLY